MNFFQCILFSIFTIIHANVTIENECKIITNATDAEYKNIVMNYSIPHTKNEQCLFMCIKKKEGFIGADNMLDMNQIKDKFDYIKNIDEAFYNRTLQVFFDCQWEKSKLIDECSITTEFAQCVYPKLAALEPDVSLSFDNIRDKCREKLGTTEDEEENDPRKEQCLLACIGKRTKVLNDDNTLNMDILSKLIKILHIANRNEINTRIQLFQQCKNAETAEIDECEAVKKLRDCIIKEEKLPYY